jgi:acyl dehydratase
MIDPAKLLALRLPDIEHRYSEKDAILYALGVGLGQNPLDPRELSFVYEKNLKVLPTFVLVLGWPAFWLRDYAGIDFARALHGEEAFELHRPLAPSGEMIGRIRITDVIDKGADKGALVYCQRLILDRASGERIATLRQTVFCRGDGGFGGAKRTQPAPHPIPPRAPDLVCDLPTRPETALIYRLSGDTNPLHVDPAAAKAAGFDRPILHGLATFGVAGHAVLRSLCDYDESRIVSMAGRFSAPVYPGTTVRTEMWRDGNIVSFRARVVGREVVAIDNGRVQLQR